MRIAASLISVGVAAVTASCIPSSGAAEPRGATKARYTGPVPVVFTNATPDRMCGFYMIDDREEEYGDNWLPEAGVPSGGSVQFRVKPGRYKARWDTCKAGGNRPYFAATLWREAAVTVQRETQLYAYIADSVAPTKRAAVKGRDHHVVRFPGQAIDPDPRPQPRQEPRTQQVALLAATEPPQIAGFIGRVMLSAAQVAARDAEPEVPAESFNAREFVDRRGAAAAKPAPVKPSLNRKHDLSSSGIEYRKR